MTATSLRPTKRTTGRSLVVPRWLRSSVRLADVVAPAWTAQAVRRLYFRPPRFQPSKAEREVLAQGTPFVSGQGETQVVGRTFGQGPAVLLLHGWGGQMGQLTAFVEPLTRRGRRAVLVDWPAHGQSAGNATSLPRVARALLELQAVVGGFDAVVAHSFGAPAVLAAMARGASWRRLALLAPVSLLSRYFDRFSEAFGLSPEAKARFVAASEQWLGEPVASFEPLALAPKFTTPLLAVHSTEDEEAPLEDTRALVERWPGAQLEAVTGLGHRRLLKDAAVLRRVVDFVAEPQPGAPA